MTASSATIFLPAPVRPARMPGGVFSAFADLVLTSDDVDQSVRWTPGERLHHLFEQRCDDFRAAGDRGHLAVARGPLALSYEQLDARANRMARFLRAHGVRPGDRVGLVFDDALDSYVGMLATLKLNAAYVPLDAAFPPDRLAFIVDDARVGTVLTVSGLRDRLSGAPATVLCVDQARAEIDRLDPRPARPGRAGRAGRGPLLHHLHLRHHRPAQGRGHRARRDLQLRPGGRPGLRDRRGRPHVPGPDHRLRLLGRGDLGAAGRRGHPGAQARGATCSARSWPSTCGTSG